VTFSVIHSHYKIIGALPQRTFVSHGVRQPRLEDPPTAETALDADHVRLLFSGLQTSADPTEILDELFHMTRTPDLVIQVQELVGLADAVAALLPDSASHEINSRAFGILANVFKIPDFVADFAVEALAAVLSDRVSQWETTDGPFQFLRLLCKLARPPVTGQFFVPFIDFLRDWTASLPIVRLVFKLATRITVLSLTMCGVFLEHDFLTPAFRYLNRIAGDPRPIEGEPLQDDEYSALAHLRNKTFSTLCTFVSRVCLGGWEVLPYLPDDFQELHSDLVVLCNDWQLLSLFQYLMAVATNAPLFELFVYMPLVENLVRMIEEGTFRVAHAAARYFVELMTFRPELFHDIVVDCGTLDFLLRFFETQDARLIEAMLRGLAALSNRFVGDRPNADDRR
jgi:hypothetical protein